MARLKLIEYLNDPSLLSTISEEEMRAWAAEVPYAGLVQRLLAQKLAIDATKKGMADKATTMAILSNANPDKTIRTIEDFKSMVLRHDDDNDTSSTDQNDSDHIRSDGIPIRKEDIADDVPSSEEREADAVEHLPKVEEVSTTNDASTEAEGFSEWLEGLKSLEEIDEDPLSEIELEDKEIASDALAQLLVAQGHYARAIAMYEILLLKNPQKSSFFAAQIEKLKAL